MKGRAALQRENDALWARLDAVRLVIENGYPSKGLRHGEKCEHGSFGFEDCIGCYDEALMAALDGGDEPPPPRPEA